MNKTELIDAVRNVATQVQAGTLRPDQIDEAVAKVTV